MKLEVTATLIDFNTIQLDTVGPVLENVHRCLIKLQDEAVRKALRELGWAPPPSRTPHHTKYYWVQNHLDGRTLSTEVKEGEPYHFRLDFNEDGSVLRRHDVA